MEDLDPRGQDIEILTENEGYVVWVDFVDSKMETLKGGTLQSYLGSYDLFLKFVTTERVRKGQVLELHDDTLRIFRNTLLHLKSWRKTINTKKKAGANRQNLARVRLQVDQRRC